MAVPNPRRRTLLLALPGLVLLAALPGPSLSSSPRVPALDRRKLQAELRRLERESGGRIGLALLDSGSGARFDWRGDERFPMCSTFKWLLAAAVLQRVDRGVESLERRIAVPRAELVVHSPFTETRASASVRELCEATITLSDNTAANLLLPSVGGPAGLTTFLRSIGDPRTRLDRTETALNSAIPGDPRDTTTPRGMVDDLQKLLLGDTLAAASRAQLLDWLRANQTGGARLRAGLPTGWRVGDKTGSGANGTTNDVAILWPPGRAPLLVAAYLTGSKLDSPGRDAVHASLARALSQS